MTTVNADRKTRPISFKDLQLDHGRGPALADPEICRQCHWQLLADMSEMIASISSDFDETLSAILDSAIRLVDGDRGMLMLFSDDGTLRARKFHNLSHEDLKAEDFRPSLTIVKQVLDGGEGLAITDTLSDLMETSPSESMVLQGIRSVVCCPLRLKLPSDRPHQAERAKTLLHHRNGLIGLLYVDSASAASGFAKYDLHVLQSLANHASVVLLSAATFRQATVDGLTDAFRPEHFRLRLEEELALSGATNQPVSLVLLDVDHFKTINDTYGHPVGDRVLGKLGRILSSTVEKDDIVGRLGGDEFGLVLVGREKLAAWELANEILQEVRATTFSGAEGARFAATLSMGLVSSPEWEGNAQDLMSEADQQLYAAKQAGRNRVAMRA